MTTRSNNQSEAIVLAATQVVSLHGTGKLTIDAVAKQAGMSKGGVLYHFPTKDALVEGMIAALLNRLDDKLTSQPESSSLAAMLSSIDFSDESERNMSLAILAASAEKPELLEPARHYYKNFVKDVRQESDDNELAMVLLLALEGLRFMHMLDLVPWSNANTKKALGRMQQLAKETQK